MRIEKLGGAFYSCGQLDNLVNLTLPSGADPVKDFIFARNYPARLQVKLADMVGAFHLSGFRMACCGSVGRV